MNNPSPLIPQGSNLEQKNKGRARVRIAVFVIISVHVVGLMALLMSGCRKPAEPVETPDTNMPAFDTNPPPPPAPTVQEYTIVRGDTFSSVAKHFGVSVKAVENANPNVDPVKLKIGQKIQIPAPTSTAPMTSAVPAADMNTAAGQTYKVKSGDTLIKIAKEFGTTVKALQSENNLGTSTSIKVGQVLKIPVKAVAPAPEPVPVPAPAPAPAPAAPAMNQ